MDAKEKKDRIAALKWELFEEVPTEVFSTDEQVLIVKGLLFDAVDKTVQLIEKMDAGV